MALNPPEGDPLDRARAAAAGDLPEEWSREWDAVAGRVRGTVSRLARPSRPLLVRAPDGAVEHDDLGSRTRVASRVVLAELRGLLSAPTHAPERIDLHVDDERLDRVEVDLVCAYGVDLHRLGGAVADAVHARLAEILGPDPDLTPDRIEVRVVDVVVGDPNLA